MSIILSNDIWEGNILGHTKVFGQVYLELFRITNQKIYFTVSAVSTLEDIPLELYTLFKWLLAGSRNLDEGVSEQVECKNHGTITFI